MNYVNTEEFNTILNTKSFEFMANEGIDSDNIGSNLKSFTSNSGNLKGEAWDKVRSKYNKYDELLTKHKTISQDMTSLIQSIISELKTAMGAITSIDLNKLPELKQQKTTCENTIKQIESQMAQRRFNIKTFKYEPVYDNASLQATLDSQRSALNELDKLITRMENIKAICDRGTSKINTFMQEMNQISSEVQEITRSNKLELSL